MSRLAPTALSLALVGILASAAHVSVEVVAAAVLVTQVIVAAAPSPTDARGRTIRVPTTAPVMVAAVAATVLTARPSLLEGAGGSEVAGGDVVVVGSLAGLLPAVALGVFAVLVSQMFRRDGRRDLVASSGHAVALMVVAALAVGWISGFEAAGDADVVVIAAAAVAGALVVWAVPGDRWLYTCLAVAGGAVAGVAATVLADTGLLWVFGLVVGGGVAVFAVLGQVLGRAWATRRRLTTAGWGMPGALSVALVGPVVHVGGQLAASF